MLVENCVVVYLGLTSIYSFYLGQELHDLIASDLASKMDSFKSK